MEPHDISERIRLVRGERTQKQFAKELGVNYQLISQYEVGTSQPTSSFLKKIIGKSGLNVNWLLTGKGEMYLSPEDSNPTREQSIINGKIKFKNVPVVGEVGCGTPLHTWHNYGNEVMPMPCASHLHNPFIVKAKGMSMYPYIRPGDQILCADEPGKIKGGSIVVVSFKTEPETAEANAKLIQFIDKKFVMLYSINSNTEPSLHSLKEIYKIFKVIRIVRDVK